MRVCTYIETPTYYSQAFPHLETAYYRKSIITTMISIEIFKTSHDTHTSYVYIHAQGQPNPSRTYDILQVSPYIYINTASLFHRCRLANTGGDLVSCFFFSLSLRESRRGRSAFRINFFLPRRLSKPAHKR